RLTVPSPSRRVREVMEPPAAAVRPEIDQEQVARLMARYNVAAVPVVDERNRLLGRVTFDDVIDVVERETTEDLLKFASVSPEEDLSAPWSAAVKSRLPWLYVNLLTAFLAGAVVSRFQGTVSLVVAGLAGASIPIVLERFSIDPAIASSIFVTTFTDVCGFVLLLGLGAWLLL